jgi:hypothetical protein
LAVFNQSDIDTYTASKTSNYITGILGEVIYSDSFISSVYKSEPNLNNNLTSNKEKSQKIWKKQVKTQILDNKGVISIDAFGSNRYQTNLLASAIGYTIINQHGIYDGSADRVTIKMIDSPTIYENWSITKIISDGLIGLLAGLFLGFTFVIIFPNHRLFELKKKKAKNFQPEEYQQTTQPSQSTNKLTEDGIDTSVTPENKILSQSTNNAWLEQYYDENLPNNQSNQD